MNDDTEKILEELRVLRKLVINLTADVAAMKPFIAAAGKPVDMTLEEVVKQMDDTARHLRNQISEYDVEDEDSPR
jgi:hypothetical protein